MAEISMGEAVGAGFGIIRRRPLAVLAWGAMRTLFAAGMFSFMAPIYLNLFNRLAAQARTGLTPTPPDFATMAQMEAGGWLLGMLGGFLMIVIYCAVFRAVLHPDQNRFAYLRIGMAELFLAVLGVGFYIAFIIGIVVIAIPVGIIVAISAAAHSAAIGALIAVLVGLAAVVGVVWIILRLSVVGPMIVQDGKFHLAEAWALTRGHAGSLFLIALCMFVILMLIESVIGVVALAIGAGVLGQMAGGFSNLPAFFSRPPATILANLAPALVVAGLASIPISGTMMAIVAAPWARAFRDLAQPDVAATFS